LANLLRSADWLCLFKPQAPAHLFAQRTI